MNVEYRICPAAENALLLTFHANDEPAGLMTFLPLLSRLTPQIETAFAQTLQDMVPSYHSLLLVLKNQDLAAAKTLLSKLVSELVTEFKDTPNLADFSLHSTAKTHHIPVCYNKQFGLDLNAVAQQKALSIDEIIQIHSERTYQVCAIGFAPAFAYLGEVDERIASPRHASPRLKIPAGSVGIADRQTAIYPKASPAGWQILGQTPWDLSLNNPDNLTRFRVGDQVKFEPIGYDEFLAIKNREAS